MVTIFNRQELMITRSMEEQARVRNLLKTAGIDYVVKSASGHSRLVASERAHMGSFGQNPDVMYEYRIFVKKEDFERARQHIGR